MKKLYRKGTVHPSPQIKSNENLLPLLPVAIFSLAALLSPDDREILAYLISGDRNVTSRLNKSKTHKKPHSPLFHCDCFSCYTSYWVRWDSSPSRELIHEIIDAFEDSLEKTEKKTSGDNKKKKDRRKRQEKSSVLTRSEVPSSIPTLCPCSSSSELVYGLESTEESYSGGGGEEEEEEKGTVRRFVNFIGEKVFGVWG